jgi:hypothetical protein
VLLLVLGGALAHLHALASRRGPSSIGSVLEAIPAPYLALRFAPLVDPSGADGALVVILGAGTAIVLAARASCVDDGHKALRGGLAATASAAVAAVGFGEPSAALILGGSAIVAASASIAAVEARRDVRWLGVACAAAVGLLPGAGASPGYILAMTAALGGGVSGSVGWAIFAAGGVVALIITSALSALSAFRVYDAVIRTAARERGLSRAQGGLAIVLALLALAFGIALGVGATPFGGNVAPFARRLVGPPAVAAPNAVAGAGVILSVMAALAGVVLARRASSASTPPGWLLALGRPYAVLAWTATGIGQAAQFLQRSVQAMDRDVVDDIPAALRDAALRAGRGLAGLGRGVSRTVDAPLERATEAVVVKLDMDTPQTAERAVTVALLVMVALLGVVVLSSLLLG